MDSTTPDIKILIVEDDTVLAGEMARFLTESGYSVHVAEDTAQARAIGWRDIDLALLDLGLPGVNGRVLCREIAESSTAGIIVVSARNELVDRVALLEMGADDYIAKPFEPLELQARIRALLRRRSTTRTPEKLAPFGPWRFSGDERQLLHEDGRVITLTTSEAKVLRYLAGNPGLVCSREELLVISRTRQHAGTGDRSVDNLIKRLRRKLEPEADQPRHIQSVWGQGYRFRAD